MLSKLIKVYPLTSRDTLFTFHCPDLAKFAQPGQFVEIKVTEGMEPFLRRPISIFSVNRENFTLLVRTAGKGTEVMARWKLGIEVDILGPLGNGFSWSSEMRTVVLAAGGIGIAPLHFAAERLTAEGRKVRILFSPSRDNALLDSLKIEDKVSISLAENRTAFPTVLSSMLDGADLLCACGPEGMLETVARIGEQRQVPTQISMERHMGCGFGICLGCAVAVRNAKAEGATYKKACKDGPVFSGKEVVFHGEL